MNQPAATNPFGSSNTPSESVAGSAVAASDQERSIAEVQSALVIAKRFPRDPVDAMNRILQACTRPTLAESAVYAFPRGGQTVEGPSIRLAESVAQEWGNMQFGVRELSQENGVSTVEAFAWDVQTNTRSTKVFQVAHKRKARGSIQTLTDPRDIYEMVANQGARRLRACILAVIPGDVVEQAVKQCNTTLAHNVQVDEESITKLTEAFAAYKVTPEMLSHRLGGKHLSSMIGAEMLQLRKIYRSIKDGMAKTADFFTMPEDASGAASNLSDAIDGTGSGDQKPEKEKVTEGQLEEIISAADSVESLDDVLEMSEGLPSQAAKKRIADKVAIRKGEFEQE